MSATVSGIAVFLAAAVAVAGCGSSSDHATATSRTANATTTIARTTPRPAASHPAALVQARTIGALPEGRSGIAVAPLDGSIVISGGLSPAGVSTATVFRFAPDGHATVSSALPGPVHDAASAALGGRLLLFGGGQFEGSNRIVAVAPGVPRVIGTLPQSLSDLVAVTIGDRAYIVGGWNGSVANRDIYAITATGRVTGAGRLPLGVRYPSVSVLGGRIIVAGGETTSGAPTTRAWSFDPASGRVTRLPDLSVATDHGMAATLDGRVYALGGLRDGAFTRAIVSWAPGESRWRASGRLPQPVADGAAVPSNGGIVLIGGRDSAGKLATVTLLKPRQS